MGNLEVASAADADHFFIPRVDQHALLKLLRSIPNLCTELAIAKMKLARLGDRARNSGGRRRLGSVLPLDVEVFTIQEELHNSLVGWVRLVCEQRKLDTPTGLSTPELARWLDKQMISLAMTEGAETALTEIEHHVKRAERIVCPPYREFPVDEGKLAQARELRLNARGIQTLARTLGDEYRHLTIRRVNSLHEGKHVTPEPNLSDSDMRVLFRVGDVLDAHLEVPIRQRAS